MTRKELLINLQARKQLNPNTKKQTSKQQAKKLLTTSPKSFETASKSFETTSKESFHKYKDLSFKKKWSYLKRNKISINQHLTLYII